MTESANSEQDINDSGERHGPALDDEPQEQPIPARAERVQPPNNVILLGAMGSGKTSIGWLLAKLIGYGFIDLDDYIEAREKQTVAQIFDRRGEDQFRQLEKAALKTLQGIKSHVIAVGGGTVVDDDNWRTLQGLGATVWINPPADEIARRFCADPEALRRRPLLADLATNSDRATQVLKLKERLSALIGQRQQRYGEARLEISDSFSTPESSAGLVRDTLVREGILNLPKEQRPYDRWEIL